MAKEYPTDLSDKQWQKVRHLPSTLRQTWSVGSDAGVDTATITNTIQNRTKPTPHHEDGTRAKLARLYATDAGQYRQRKLS